MSTRQASVRKLHYDDKISAELFGEQEASITREIEQLGSELHAAENSEPVPGDDLRQLFEQVVKLLTDLDIGTIWNAATDHE